jgi:hypothetical protein
MDVRTLHNKKDTSILTKPEFERIRGASRPPEIDNSVELERSRNAAAHEKTLAMVDNWANSIANERKARISRLALEAEEREKEHQRLDSMEHQYQKDKRKAQLRRAEKLAFEEKPEIRAVHAQLLLHEVSRERQRQLLLKERKDRIAQQKEDAYAASEKRKFEEAEQRERDLAQKRREKAILVAQEMRQQRLDAEQEKLRIRGEDVEEETLLAQEAKRLLEAEQQENLRKREVARQNVREAKAANSELIQWKENQKILDAEEVRRIEADKLKRDEGFEARAEAERKRRALRQADIDKMITRQQETLLAIKSQKDNFDDRQYDLQFAKDEKKVHQLQEERERMAAERHADFLEAQEKAEWKRRRKAEATIGTFPPDEIVQREEDAITQREAARAHANSELANFQRKQAREKSERDASDKERRQLEFNRQYDLDTEKLIEAQDYAREMLMQARARRHKGRPMTVK